MGVRRVLTRADSTRQALDQLQMTNVVQSSCASRKALEPLEDQRYYSGYIRVGINMWPYLPKRVLRQFGYIKGIPLVPSPCPLYEKCNQALDEWDQHLVSLGEVVPHRALQACTTNYLPWYCKHSYLYLLLPQEGDA